MSEFLSKNKIKMIEGKHFNWEKVSVYFDSESPWVRKIGFHKDGDFWACVWEKGVLYISNQAYSSSCSISISCNLDLAEEIVMGYVKANKFKIMPLHKKMKNEG